MVIIGKIYDVLEQRVLRMRHRFVWYAWVDVSEELGSTVCALMASTIDAHRAGKR